MKVYHPENPADKSGIKESTTGRKMPAARFTALSGRI
jgi:hypothetical protein